MEEVGERLTLERCVVLGWERRGAVGQGALGYPTAWEGRRGDPHGATSIGVCCPSTHPDLCGCPLHTPSCLQLGDMHSPGVMLLSPESVGSL